MCARPRGAHMSAMCMRGLQTHFLYVLKGLPIGQGILSGHAVMPIDLVEQFFRTLGLSVACSVLGTV